MNVIALKKELSEIENYKQSLKIENKKLDRKYCKRRTWLNENRRNGIFL